MGQAKQRAAVLAAKDITNVTELDNPEESLRRFLDRLPDERIAARFIAGMDRAGALEVFCKLMVDPNAGVFVVRDGQEVRAVLDIVRHTAYTGKKASEVSLLCEQGDHARSLFRYLRALHPHDLLIASPQDKLSPAMYRFMMRHLDAILPCPLRSWYEDVLSTEKEKVTHGPIFPVWERTPVILDYPSPLSDFMAKAPLSRVMIAAARTSAFAAGLKWKGVPAARASAIAGVLAEGRGISLQEDIEFMAAFWKTVPMEDRAEAERRMGEVVAELRDPEFKKWAARVTAPTSTKTSKEATS